MRTWQQKLLDLWDDLSPWSQYGLTVVAALGLLWWGLELIAALSAIL
jgi:hypothetical protein